MLNLQKIRIVRDDVYYSFAKRSIFNANISMS